MRTAIAYLCAGAALLQATALAQSQFPAEQPRQTFRSSVDLVTIQAAVRDNRGRPLKGLTARDFEVRDNGQLRPILSLRADVHPPVSLAILVDMSGSMRLSSKVATTRQAFDSLLAQLRSGEDEAAVFTFDSSLHERHGFTRNLSTLRGALEQFEPFGTTSLYDAAAEAARRVARRSAAHKAVLVLTDGIDTSSTLTASEVSGVASSIDVPVYVVATVQSIDEQAMTEPDDQRRRADAADLRDLADWTGGRLMFARSSAETILVASALLDELRQQVQIPIFATYTEALVGWLDRRPAERMWSDVRTNDLKIFDDPEAIFQEGWLLCDVGAPQAGLPLLQRAVAKGYAVAATLARSPAFDALRGEPAFRELLARAEADRDEALGTFRENGGEKLLGR